MFDRILWTIGGVLMFFVTGIMFVVDFLAGCILLVCTLGMLNTFGMLRVQPRKRSK